MAFFGAETKPEHGAFDSIIGGKAKFKGELVSDGSISINGSFEGRLESKGEIMVAQGSRIVGDIQAGKVTVAGRVDGNISALDGLEIMKSGRVHGDLKGGRITIEEGSSYRGRVKVQDTEETTETIEIIEEIKV